MAALYELGRAAHLEVPLAPAQFAAALESRSVEPRFAPDVYLAAAIEHRVPAALTWLQQQVHRSVRGLSERVPVQLLADIESAVLELVAVGSDQRPARIREYAARGPLVGWLQVLVSRMAQQRAEAPSTRVADGALESALLDELEHSGAGVELQVLRAKFHGALGASLRAAAQALPERDRALLRMHYVDAIGLDELGRAYQVHRATISRWLMAAREAYLVATRAELSRRTGVSAAEVDSVVRALQSQVDVSLRRVFGGT